MEFISKTNQQYLKTVSLKERFNESISGFMDINRPFFYSQITIFFLPHEINEYVELLKEYNNIK